MNPPANRYATEARADIIAYNAAMRAEIETATQAPPVAVALAELPVAIAEADAAYRLTWPARQPGVVTVAGQWRRNAAGDVEAWYSAQQLGAALVAMQETAADAAER